MTIMKAVLKQDGRCRTQNATFLRFFSLVLFLLPLLFAHTAYGDINAKLLEAALAGNTAEVQQLIKEGVDVNAKYDKGFTALIIAAGMGHTEIAKALIDAGADVNAESGDGRTALMVAEGRGNTAIVNILKQAGAQAETTNPALERLTVPAGLLPDGCKLAPSTGLPFGSRDKPNPMMTTNPEEIGLLMGFAFMGSNAELEVELKAVTDRAERRRILEERMRERAARIEVAYLAGYDDKSHKENMVWALQFKDTKEAKSYFEPLRIKNQSAKYYYYFIKDSIIIYVWTDNRGDPSCFDAIRDFLQQIDRGVLAGTKPLPPSPIDLDYAVRKQIVEGINMAGGAKRAVTAYYQARGVFPADNAEAGMNAPSIMQGRYVASISINGAVITIQYGNDADTQIAGETVTLTATDNLGNWACASGGVIQDKHLPPYCQR